MYFIYYYDIFLIKHFFKNQRNLKFLSQTRVFFNEYYYMRNMWTFPDFIQEKISKVQRKAIERNFVFFTESQMIQVYYNACYEQIYINVCLKENKQMHEKHYIYF
ncbi:hypothetical protein EDEG_01253 [Edhazardia aedis USNM 41457]|uniref:Uncharacterized protein n=1 Tax=Edhazardia aedis (strain USNM 41457) TaxID=1003232 RepID=J9D9Y5_EDHAE|nr:hypothetical protein EDEG_01253 [Edhazardia aedis USNM 41457]|eukprot:EJW04541.1 hypothetical protein EDEG_01253 [Edhazardia aedis USNM 41457]